MSTWQAPMIYRYRQQLISTHGCVTYKLMVHLFLRVLLPDTMGVYQAWHGWKGLVSFWVTGNLSTNTLMCVIWTASSSGKHFSSGKKPLQLESSSHSFTHSPANKGTNIVIPLWRYFFLDVSYWGGCYHPCIEYLMFAPLRMFSLRCLVSNKMCHLTSDLHTLI